MSNTPQASNTNLNSSSAIFEYQSAVNQLEEMLSYVIEVLNQRYLNEKKGQTLKKELEICKKILEENTETNLDTLVFALQKNSILLEKNQIKISQAFTRIKNNFSKEDNNPSLAAEKYSLTYLLDISLALVFPNNLLDQNNGNVEVFYTISMSRKWISPEDRSQLMPACDYYLHLPSFLIETSVAWQDRIRAAYFLSQQKKPLVKNINIRRNENAPQGTEIDLELIRDSRRNKKKLDISVATLSLDRIEFYYEMIYQAATQHTLVAWENYLRESPGFYSWLVAICHYSIIQREITYCADPQKLDQLNTKKQKISETFQFFQFGNFSNQYLGLPIDSTILDQSAVEEKIGKILAKFALPSFCHAVTSGTISLEEALKEPDTRWIEKHKKLFIQSTRQAQALTKLEEIISKNQPVATYFDTFLKHTQLTKETFVERILLYDTLDEVFECLFSSGILTFINQNIEAKIIIWKNLIDVPGTLTIYTKNLQNAAKLIIVTSNPTLEAFITEYNTSDDAKRDGSINFTREDKKYLAPLKDFVKEFQAILEQTPLAQKVLDDTHDGPTDLLNLLNDYEDLPTLLRGKKHQNIISLAERYCFNAKNEVVLKAIQLSGLSIQQGLSLSDATRVALEKYHGDLLALLAGRYILDPTQKNCEKYVYRHLKNILTNRASVNTQDAFLEVIQDGLHRLDNDLLVGLVQQEVLSLEEVLTFDIALMARFERAQETYHNLNTNHKDWIRRKGGRNLAHITSQIRDLINTRERLDELKNSPQNEKHYFQESKAYLDKVIQFIERININLNSHFTDSIDAVARAGIPFIEAVSISEIDRKAIKQDYEQAQMDFKKVSKKAQEIVRFKEGKRYRLDLRTLFEATEADTLEDLLRKIIDDNSHIQLTQLYSYAIQIMDHSDTLIKDLYIERLISLSQIVRLDEKATKAFKKLLNNNGLLKSHGKAYRQHLKYIFKLHTTGGNNITSLDIEKISQSFDSVLQYLESPLINKINQGKNIKAQILIDAILEFRESTHEEGFEHILEERFLDIIQANRSILPTIKHQQDTTVTYDNFLSRLFLLDPLNQKASFSLHNIFECCTRYLDNLQNFSDKSSLPKILIDLGLDPMLVFASREEDQNSLNEKYESLYSLLQEFSNRETLREPTPSEISELDDNDIGEIVRNFIEMHPTISFEEVGHMIEIASQMLRDAVVISLIEEGLSPAVAMQLSKPSIDILREITEQFSSENKQSFYIGFNRYMNKMFNNSGSIVDQDALTQKFAILQLPIFVELLRSQLHRTEEFLNSLDQIDLTAINTAFNNISQKIDKWKILSDYTSPQLIAIAFIRSQQNLDQLQKFLNQLSEATNKQQTEIKSLIKSVPIERVLSVPQKIASLYTDRNRFKKRNENKEYITQRLLNSIAKVQQTNMISAKGVDHNPQKESPNTIKSLSPEEVHYSANQTSYTAPYNNAQYTTEPSREKSTHQNNRGSTSYYANPADDYQTPVTTQNNYPTPKGKSKYTQPQDLYAAKSVSSGPKRGHQDSRDPENYYGYRSNRHSSHSFFGRMKDKIATPKSSHHSRKSSNLNY